MRRIAAAGLALVAILLAIDTGAWLWGVARAKAAFAAWTASMNAQGWTVASGPPTGAGWPFAIGLDIPDLKLAGGAAAFPGGFEWDAERLAARVSVTDAAELRAVPAGRQTLRFAEAPALPYTADQLAITIPLRTDSPSHQHIDINGRGIRIGPAGGGTADLALFAAHIDTWASPAKGSPSLAISTSAEAVTLPPPPDGSTYALGTHIASAVIEATLTGEIPVATDPAAAAAAWRDAGGQIRIGNFSLGWGPLGVSGTATVRLDQHLQPSGSGTIRIVGTDDTIAALQQAHVISAGTATAVRSLVGLFARPPSGGGEPELQLPFTVANSTFSIGNFPLQRLPPLVWPSAP